MAIINAAGIKATVLTEEFANSVDGSVVVQSDDIRQALVNVPEQHYTPRFFGVAGGALLADLFLADNTFIPTIRLDHVPGAGTYQAISFECTSLSDIPPTITVYWTTTGVSNSVVYATCSSSAPSAFNWVPPKRTYTVPVINTIAFTPGTNYTEALIGGDFGSVGSLTANNLNYFTVDLSGGPTILSGGLNFGPVGRVLTNTPTTSTYYGGISGIRFNGEVTCILPVSVAPGQEYICYGGNFTGVQLYNSQTMLSCVGLFIVDKNNPLGKNVRFNMRRDANDRTIPLCLEYAADYKSLIVGGSAFSLVNAGYWGAYCAMYASLTANTPFIGGNSSLSPLFDIDLSFNPTSANLWDRFKIKGVSSNIDVYTKLGAIKALKYFKGVLYIGGNFHRYYEAVDANFDVVGRRPDGTWSPIFFTGGDYYYAWPYIIPGNQKGFQAGAGGYAVNSIKIQQIGQKTVLYICGNFTKTIADTWFGTWGSGPEAPYLAAYDITKSLSGYSGPGPREFPIYLSAWNPIFDKPVVDLDYSNDDESLYVIGGFTKVTAVVEGKKVAQPASRFVILSQPDLVSNTPPIIHKPYINIAGGAFSYSDVVKVIPSESSLSGVLIATNMTTINLAPAKVIARLPRKDKSISPAVAKHIQWTISSKVVNVGDTIAVDSTQFDAITAYPGENYQLQKLIYNAPLEPGVGDLMRFYIQRTNDQNPNQLSASRVWITGIKVSHEQ